MLRVLFFIELAALFLGLSLIIGGLAGSRHALAKPRPSDTNSPADVLVGGAVGMINWDDFEPQKPAPARVSLAKSSASGPVNHFLRRPSNDGICGNAGTGGECEHYERRAAVVR